MEFIGNILGIGAKILAATIFLGIVVALVAFGFLDETFGVLVAVFDFLFIKCGGLFIDIIRKLIDKL